MNVEQLPKVELHCHPEGIISPQIVAQIRETWPDYPIHPDDFVGKNVHDYDSFWAWWQAIEPLDRQLKYLYPVIEIYIEQLKAQNVRYSELMVSSGYVSKDTAQALDEMQALREFVNERENGEIQVEFMIACGRHNTADSFRRRADRMIALYEAGLICGIAIGSIEPGNPVQKFTDTMARWHETGMGIEVHAGEWVGAESVWDALNYGYPDRIGHGVTLFDDPKLIELFQEKQIHIEMCPTSNLKTGSIKRIDDHPIVKAKELGLNFSINTDDPGPFECSMNSEFELMANVFGFTEDDFERIYGNSLASRFQKQLRTKNDRTTDY